MAKYIIDANNTKSHINKNIYGHFSEHLGRCIYEGLQVGEDSKIPNINGVRKDVIDALKEMKIPLLRWPGGCFADEYHWEDGIGKNRKKMINTNWGGIVEDNSFGTHEFLNLCEELECEPYIAGNVGSGTVKELSNWVEYMNFDGVSPMSELRKENGRQKPWHIKYLGVGNENWGCGGNMTAQYYADEFKRYSSFAKNYKDAKLYKIACGPNTDDYNWTEVMMKKAKRQMDALALHYYTVPLTFTDGGKGSATDFNEEIYYKTLSHTVYMEELVKKHIGIMELYDKEGEVDLVVDEWGAWYDVEEGTNPGFLYQQNTMRDAIIAGINLNIFNKYSYRIKMANIAQIVNVLQSVILTEGEKIIKTPTYYVFKMFAAHQGATLLDSFITKKKIGTNEDMVDDLYESASIDDDGKITTTICNLDLNESKLIDAEIIGYNVKLGTAQILTGEMNAYNDFGMEDEIKSTEFNNIEINGSSFKATIPPCSVISLTFSKE